MANQSNNQSRGFAAMPANKRKNIAKKGGESQGKDTNPGNFANDTEKARRAGAEGGSK
jgi:uncharacterized protein